MIQFLVYLPIYWEKSEYVAANIAEKEVVVSFKNLLTEMKNLQQTTYTHLWR